jgi:hypothetical protein
MLAKDFVSGTFLKYFKFRPGVDLLRCSNWMSSLSSKYKTRVKVTDNDKHPILLQYKIIYNHKMFYSIWTCE